MDVRPRIISPAGPPAPFLAGDRIRLRPVLPEDVPVLAAILAEPEVARWWPGYDTTRVEEELLGGDAETIVWAIEARLGGPDAPPDVVGAIQAWEEPNEEYRHAGLDLFLATAAQGRGLGPRGDPRGRPLALRRARPSPPDDRPGRGERASDPHVRGARLPAGRNAPVVRAAAGRQWVDGLLMELLAGELVE